MNFLVRHWTLLVGLAVAGAGLLALTRGEVPVGIDGEEPLFRLRGKAARHAAIVWIVLGVDPPLY